MPVAHKKEKRYTYADYLTWDDEFRCEIINGIVFEMSAAPSTRHERIKVRLLTEIALFLKGKKCEVFDSTFDVRFPKNENTSNGRIYSVVQPDIAIICDRTKIDDRGCLGAPDFIIEILSPSTIRSDRSDKYYLYQNSGVTEYWIVDSDNDIIEVFILNDGIYKKEIVYTANDNARISMLKGLRIDLSNIFKR